MKIETELRQAISAAAKAQPEPPGHQERLKAELVAIKALDKKLKGKITRINNRYTNPFRSMQAAQEEMATLGLDAGNPIQIESGDDFIKAGGILPQQKKKWQVETIIFRLSSATDQKQFDAILAEIGIHWK